MGQPIIHADQLYLDQAVGHGLQGAKSAGIITDTQVNTATTNAGLRAALASGYAGHVDGQPLVPVAQRALDVGKDDGSMSDDNVNAATTVPELTANTFADPTKTGPQELPN